MREQQCGETGQNSQTAGQWPAGCGVVDSERSPVRAHDAASTGTASPLMPLALDTILTAGDIKRLLKIVSSS
ncbi:MAG: hypothetical protein H7838_08495 [Magnetococcus sp. DMHC-8]